MLSSSYITFHDLTCLQVLIYLSEEASCWWWSGNGSVHVSTQAPSLLSIITHCSTFLFRGYAVAAAILYDHECCLAINKHVGKSDIRYVIPRLTTLLFTNSWYVEVHTRMQDLPASPPDVICVLFKSSKRPQQSSDTRLDQLTKIVLHSNNWHQCRLNDKQYPQMNLYITPLSILIFIFDQK